MGAAAAQVRGTPSAPVAMAPELIAPSEREPQMKNEKTTTDQKADKEIAQEPAKKRPAIIGIFVPSAKFSVVPNTTTGLVFWSR